MTDPNRHLLRHCRQNGGDFATAAQFQAECENVAAGCGAPGVYSIDGVSLWIDERGAWAAQPITPAAR